MKIVPLPEKGQENDVDQCFAHFDRVIADLRAEGYESHQIIADFTRGTKAMSAALALAGVRHDLPELRYIEGEREGSGTVKAGSEVIRRGRPIIVTGRRRLDDAHTLLRHGDFAGVLRLLARSVLTPWLPVAGGSVAHFRTSPEPCHLPCRLGPARLSRRGGGRKSNSGRHRLAARLA